MRPDVNSAHACMCACVHVCVHACVRACMCACVHVRVVCVFFSPLLCCPLPIQAELTSFIML